MAFKQGMKTTTTTMPPPPSRPGRQTATILEVTVVSGECVRLRSGRALARGAYAVVHTACSFAVTRVDDEEDDCGGYPYWGSQPVRVGLPPGARGIDVEICCRSRRNNNNNDKGKGAGRGESVAAARVPVEDFFVGPPGHLHCLSYRLFDTGGVRGRNGIVNITVRRLLDDDKSNNKMPAVGKAVDGAGASSKNSSFCGVVGDHDVKHLAMPAPAGVVIGYPVGLDFSGTTGQANYGKGIV